MTGTVSHAIRCWGAVVAVAAWVLACTAQPAGAHAVLQTVSPADGSVVDAAPDEVRLRFNESVGTSLGAVRVLDRDGRQVDLGDAGNDPEDPSQVRVGLPADLGDGTYVATWRAVSADGHPVNGAFVFSVGDASAADDISVAAILAQSTGGETLYGAVAGAVRAVVYGAALLAVGGVVFLLAVHDRLAEERDALVRVVSRAALVGAAGSLLLIPLQGAVATGLGGRALVDTTALASVVSSSLGRSVLVRAVGLVALAVVVRRLWDRAAVAASAVTAAVVVGAFSLTGHTVSTEPRWLVTIANLAHTASGAAWFGGLCLLLVTMRRRRGTDDALGGGGLVTRFSRVAGVALVAVTLAGTALAYAQVRVPRALFGTAYGWTLVAKLAMVGAVVVLAAYNRRRLLPAIVSGRGDAWGLLRRTVRLEVAGLLLVVAATAVLVNLVPAREAAGVTGLFSRTVALGADHELDVTVDPNRAGQNTMHLYLLDAETLRLADDIQQLTLEFEMPSSDVAPIAREPEVTGPGHWTLVGPELSIPGQWTMTVRARVSDFEESTAQVEIPVNA